MASTRSIRKLHQAQMAVTIAVRNVLRHPKIAILMSTDRAVFALERLKHDLRAIGGGSGD